MTTISFSSLNDLTSKLKQLQTDNSMSSVDIEIPGQGDKLRIRTESIRTSPKGGFFCSGFFNSRNALFIIGKPDLKIMNDFTGRFIYESRGLSIKKCRITRTITEKLAILFPFCAPSSLQKKQKTFVISDLLGIALKPAFRAQRFKSHPIWVEQNMTYLNLSDVNPKDILDQLIWSAFEEGKERKYGFGISGISTTEDLDKVLDVGFTGLTIETDQRALLDSRKMEKKELLERIFGLPWIELRDQFELVFHRYYGRRIEFLVPGKSSTGLYAEPFVIAPSEKEVLMAICSFASVILQLTQMEKQLQMSRCRDRIMLMVSFARPEDSLTPFEHYFVMNELMRRDIYPDFISPGSLSKEHLLIAHNARLYGLRGHLSDLDKMNFKAGVPIQFEVYQPGSFVLLEMIGNRKPDLFRELWDTSRRLFFEAGLGETDNLSIHHIPKHEGVTDEELTGLLQGNGNYFLKHVLPLALNAKAEDGTRYIKHEIGEFLLQHEEEFIEKASARY